MTERDPHRRLAAARARAEVATARRSAADRAARRAEQVAHTRAALALAAARRAPRPVIGAAMYTHPPTQPTLEIRAARARRWPSYFVDAARERDRRASDLLAATCDSHDAYDWETTL